LSVRVCDISEQNLVPSISMLSNNNHDFSVLVWCTQVNMMLVMLLWVYIHTGQAWKICLTTVGIEPTTFGILALGYFIIHCIFINSLDLSQKTTFSSQK
jgi:hypothetical protein